MNRIIKIIFLDILKNKIVLAYTFILAILSWSSFGLEDNSAKGLLTILNVILFTVPLALGGALLSLWYFNETLNIFSQIGIIMLIGLVTKNGILIVEFGNQRKAAGLDKFEAIKDAALSRLRPILMTSLSTILGILPIALALGAGSESRVSMGITVIFGLLFSTLLTLYVIPAVYSYLSTSKAYVSNVTEESTDYKPLEIT